MHAHLLAATQTGRNKTKYIEIRVIVSMVVMSYASDIIECDVRRSELAMTKIGHGLC
jgi:hypothetical protein